ncbi:hypothetical protein NS228_06065 [Methylobacterium indicum]|uniref:hypothetical protein n=1 Tax=Methylobacterium indicum TaxID=1775910 RepID=UPI000734E22F|nr:hypothetical protein [Methylobacterium indicum]KTS30884.1 hypothetical protein NS229_14765 [Methylobacterium indicum]KTS41528.1 hypothetical protein NS228_06065 [Methylobacterium indicum]KTS52418.1 hypothetical protein NS230_09850 [Methylobacterium indicum]
MAGDDLRDLLAKMQAASGAQHSIDVQMQWLLSQRLKGVQPAGLYSSDFRPLEVAQHTLALIEAVIPGAHLDLGGTMGLADWCASLRVGNFFGGSQGRTSPHLALCTALVGVVVAMEGQS